MNEYAPLLAALVALLAGLTIGKAWERYKLRDGTWIDRRRARQSPHYILGLNFLVANQIDLAIEELTHAASLDAEALEVHMILGNLYREKGQVGKAITIHQTLLQRPKLSRIEHAYVLLCLGLDYKRGGFVDRALDAFNEVLRLDPKNQYALVNLQKLHEEQHQWTEAYDTRQRLTKLAAHRFATAEPGDPGVPRERDRARGDAAEGLRRGGAPFQAAIDLDARAVPAYLNLGDVRVARATSRRRRRSGNTLVQVAPDRAYLAFDRLEAQADAPASPERFTQSVPPPHRREPAGLARPARAVTAPGRRGQPPRRSSCCSPRWSRTRTRSAFTRRSGARSAQLGLSAGARGSLR